MFTKEEKCTRLYDALSKTKRFDYNNNHISFAMIHWTLMPIVRKFIRTNRIPLHSAIDFNIWKISKEKAIHFTVTLPPEVHLSKLESEHMSTVNENWPYRSVYCEGFLNALVEMSGGYGLFLREDGRMVAWILKDHMGQLCVLQVVEGFTRRGYGSLLTKFLSREIAEEGHDPMGTVLEGNEASEKMFEKLGFGKSDVVTYFYVTAPCQACEFAYSRNLAS